MPDLTNALSMQFTLLAIMVVGYIAAKLKIITDEGRRCLTDITVGIVLPCNIIMSFYVKVSPQMLTSLSKILLISFAVQLLQLALSRVLYPHISGKRKKVMQYGTICSNAGYLGNPVVQGIYGMEGLLYTSIYLIPARIFLWSAGLACFTKSSPKQMVKNLLTHPCIIAVEIGLVLMISGITLPFFVEKTIRTVGDATTVFSMLSIGGLVAGANLRTIFSKDNFYYCFVRLILVPLLVLGIGNFFGWDKLLLGVAVVLAGMPAGATTSMLADKYDGDGDFASKCVVLSTVLSMLTIPLLVMLV